MGVVGIVLVPLSSSSSMSVFAGRGCEASSRSFADSRSVRASSTGAKTRERSLVRWDFLTLDRSPFAIVNRGCNGFRKGGVRRGGSGWCGLWWLREERRGSVRSGNGEFRKVKCGSGLLAGF